MNERRQELQRRLEPYLDEIRDRWDNLPERQRRNIRVGAGVAAVLLPLLLLVLPLLRSRLEAQREWDSTQQQLREMRQLERVVLEQGLNTTAKTAEAPSERSGSLLRTVDGIARKLKINSLVQAMRPINQDASGEAVEIQLKGLVLSELVELLYQLEVAPGSVTVRRLEITKSQQEPNVLRTSLELVR